MNRQNSSIAADASSVHGILFVHPSSFHGHADCSAEQSIKRRTARPRARPRSAAAAARQREHATRLSTDATTKMIRTLRAKRWVGVSNVMRDSRVFYRTLHGIGGHEAETRARWNGRHAVTPSFGNSETHVTRRELFGAPQMPGNGTGTVADFLSSIDTSHAQRLARVPLPHRLGLMKSNKSVKRKKRNIKRIW